ncbi:MAG: ABC-type transport auxiliary lipoprotein family protein [Burkholderiaceae bacterium]|nr:ABC-type transport auxiliary lipoprotein family protein [Burkholderiaceae bacterium]
MTSASIRPLLCCAAALALTGAVGCSGLLPKPAPLPAFYTLDDTVGKDKPAQGGRAPDGPEMRRRPTLLVHPPHAAAGFDSTRIVYTRESHRLEYFAHSEWVDTPARMLTPLIVAAIVHSDSVQAVVTAPSAAASDIGLDTEIVRLQHDFGVAPSRVRFTLRVALVDGRTRKVLASRVFDESADSPSEDARGGVEAAHHAVQVVLRDMAALCSDAATAWRAADAARPDAGRDTTQAP